ncbi:tetratricopeptide repeat protein [Epibacterium sp. SM1969]|uniref:Tetratricopeptide repeat protein n=1 Tax=Tritonibacter aquimaris TaxID=2663379 RepID=A0A844ATM7_9RHOB|nr:tetratricopeptide repeat protein [Tritonibacter aquimaris]MQY42698.1 tetratricopeptide repeat protein [Tritonibacter aquimaris]
MFSVKSYVICVFSALLMLGQMAHAEARSVDMLLGDLASSDAQTAIDIDRELQAIWRKSGSASMDLMLRRGVDALERGDAALAHEHLSALVDHAPDFAAGWFKRAEALFRLDQIGPAIADLERALALNPNDYNALFALGTVFEHLQSPKRAFDAYTRAKAIHPHHEEVISALERLTPQVQGQEL